jgi:hypothetical protein
MVRLLYVKLMAYERLLYPTATAGVSQVFRHAAPKGNYSTEVNIEMP